MLKRSILLTLTVPKLKVVEIAKSLSYDELPHLNLHSLPSILLIRIQFGQNFLRNIAYVNFVVLFYVFGTLRVNELMVSGGSTVHTLNPPPPTPIAPVIDLIALCALNFFKMAANTCSKLSSL